MKISVITVCFNAASNIGTTIQSVINQSYSNLEYIIIDGGSTDGTVDIIKKYKANIKYFISEPDHGIFDAMNKSLEIATGDWVNFMNAGDVYANSHVIENVFKQNIEENTGIIFGSTLTFKGKMKMTPFIYVNSRYKNMGICHQSMFVRMDLAKKFRFDLNFKLTADYNMAMKIYQAGYKLVEKQFPIAIFDLNGYSSKHAIQQMKETAVICNAEHSLSFYTTLAIYKLKSFIKQIIKKS